MKKKLTSLLLASLGLGLYANAQIVDLKTPKTHIDKNTVVPTKTFELPSLNAEELLADLEKESFNNAIGKLVPTSISFPEDGTIIVANDGTKIWRVKVVLPQSLGLGFYFDKFKLPQGVEMFLYNENRRHVKGTYTSEDNNEDLTMGTGPVQGHIAYLELNIQPDVNIENIELHVDNIGSYFRGALPEFRYYADGDEPSVIGLYDNVFFKASSTCMINARCPEGNGFENQRKATVHTIITVSTPTGDYLYTCSGTMVNKIGNTTSSCTKYLLTASHCEPDNLKAGLRFSSNYIIRYNNESAICANPPSAPNAREITGVSFVARSNYDDDLPASYIKADFLLLEVTKPIPDSWDVVLNGWKANIPTLTVTAPNKIIGFHHPGGDIKKVSYAKKITNYALGAAGTHWNMQTEVGYAAQGSSGSGLFDHQGRLIGIASVSTGVGPTSCKTAADGSPASSTSYDLSYSKFSYCWLNPGDGGTIANTQLKPWLAGSTDEMTANPASSNCTPITTGTEKIIPFSANLNIYPNPSDNGIFEVNITIGTASDYVIEVYDISGRVILSQEYQDMGSQIVKLDLSNVNNGIYMVKLSNGFGSVTHKVTVAK